MAATVMKSGHGLQAEVSIVGWKETMAALRGVEPKIYRTLNRELRKIATDIARGASALSPHRTGAMAAGYSVKRGKTRSAAALGYAVRNETAQGAILEFAGSVSQGATAQGASLIRSLDAKYGPPGRFLWAAYDSASDAYFARVVAIKDRAEAELQRALDAAGRAA